jgi:maltose O-acetyltransferase
MLSPFKDRNGQPLSWQVANKKIINRVYSYHTELITALLWLLSYFPSHGIRKLFLQLAGMKIGNKSFIHVGCRVYEPKNIFIGKGSIIGDHVVLDGRSKLTIGDHVDIASHVMIWNASRDIHTEEFSLKLGEVIIEDYVFIGPRVIILPGVKIGKGAVIGAGAVVTKDLPEKCLAVGIPAKVIRNRNISIFKYRLGRPRLFV